MTESEINSEAFKKELLEAIKSGKDTDYVLVGDDEQAVDIFNEDIALDNVIEVLKKRMQND